MCDILGKSAFEEEQVESREVIQGLEPKVEWPAEEERVI